MLLNINSLLFFFLIKLRLQEEDLLKDYTYLCLTVKLEKNLLEQL